MNALSGSDLQHLTKQLELGESTYLWTGVTSVKAFAVVVKEDIDEIDRLKSSQTVKAIPYCEEGSPVFEVWVGTNEMFAREDNIVTFTLPLDDPKCRDHIIEMADDLFGIELYVINDGLELMYHTVIFNNGHEDRELQNQLKKMKLIS